MEVSRERMASDIGKLPSSVSTLINRFEISMKTNSSHFETLQK